MKKSCENISAWIWEYSFRIYFNPICVQIIKKGKMICLIFVKLWEREKTALVKQVAWVNCPFYCETFLLFKVYVFPSNTMSQHIFLFILFFNDTKYVSKSLVYKLHFFSPKCRVLSCVFPHEILSQNWALITSRNLKLQKSTNTVLIVKNYIVFSWLSKIELHFLSRKWVTSLKKQIQVRPKCQSTK